MDYDIPTFDKTKEEDQHIKGRVTKIHSKDKYQGKK
jgi:hypothetical protein